MSHCKVDSVGAIHVLRTQLQKESATDKSGVRGSLSGLS